MIDVLLAGDLYIGRGFHTTVGQPVIELIKSAKHALINIEAPITDTSDQIEKSGPHLTMPASSLDHVKKLGFTVLALANNHILDAGLTGLGDTLRSAHERGFQTVGATTEVGGAQSARKARLPLSEGSLTVLNYCEHEWSVREDGAGASGWNVLDVHSDVREAHKLGDHVLVVLHGGNEYFPLPRPGLRKELRFLADNGADAIVMHHSHVSAAYEVWNDVPIFYGIGNFQFTLPSPHGGWYEGLLVALSFPAVGPTQFELVPIRQSQTFDCSLASEDQRIETLQQLEGYRIQVSSDLALEARWREFAQQVHGGLIRGIAPTSFIRPVMVRRVADFAFAYVFKNDLQTQRTLLDFLQCESHHEVLRTALSNQLPPAMNGKPSRARRSLGRPFRG
jgi:poly-gamma-glutamate capsule biosynthesis protein CapA/YwtB (metallophosphatase superfamily)